MTADVTLQAESVRPLRRRNLTFGLSARILGMVIAAVMPSSGLAERRPGPDIGAATTSPSLPLRRLLTRLRTSC